MYHENDVERTSLNKQSKDATHSEARSIREWKSPIVFSIHSEGLNLHAIYPIERILDNGFWPTGEKSRSIPRFIADRQSCEYIGAHQGNKE